MSSQPSEYSIASVTDPVTEELRGEVARFWLSNGAIESRDEALRRAHELVCVARNSASEIVAVNTTYVASFRAPDQRYYWYRMYIRPRDRHLRLTYALMRAGVAALRERRQTEPDIRGIALVVENWKLQRASGRRSLTYLGWHPEGCDSRGRDLWGIEFDSPR